MAPQERGLDGCVDEFGDGKPASKDGGTRALDGEAILLRWLWKMVAGQDGRVVSWQIMFGPAVFLADWWAIKFGRVRKGRG